MQGLPKEPRLANFSWSPDESKMAFTHTTNNGVELWVLNVEDARAKKLTEAKLNANMRDVINWFKDNNNILVKMLPEDRKELINPETAVPTGPTVSVSEGKEAQNRTYQDLKNLIMNITFRQLARAELVKVNLDGSSKKWMAPENVWKCFLLSKRGVCDGESLKKAIFIPGALL